MSWPDIQKSLKNNPNLPLLWLANEASATPSDLPVEHLQAVSLRTLQAFINRAVPVTRRAAA